MDSSGISVSTFDFTLEVIEDTPITLSEEGERMLQDLSNNPIVVDQEITRDTAITLPAFTGGNGILTHSLVGTDGTAVEDGPLDALGLNGLSFYRDTLKIYGTLTNAALPNGQSSRSITLKYCAEDTNGLQGTRLFTLNLRIPSTYFETRIMQEMTATVGVLFQSSPLPRATGMTGNENFTYSFIPGLPEGLSINPSSRIISGRPTTMQENTTYTYIATDDAGNVAEMEFNLRIDPNTRPRALPFIDERKFYAGERVEWDLGKTDGGNEPLRYGLLNENDEALPISDGKIDLTDYGFAGLSYYPTEQTIRGTLGENEYRLTDPVIFYHQVLDSDNDPRAESFKISYATNDPPNFPSSISDESFYVGEFVDKGLGSVPGTLSLENGPLTYELLNASGEKIPVANNVARLDDFDFPGLHYDPTTQRISGTLRRLPDEFTYPRTVTFRHKVGDSDLDTSTNDERFQPFILKAVELIPTLMTTNATTTIVANVNRELSHQLPDFHVSNPDDSGLTTSQINAYMASLSTRITPRGETTEATLPQGLFYHPDTLSLIGTPTALSSATEYTYHVVDSLGTSVGTFDFTLSVEEDVPVAPTSGTNLTFVDGQDLTANPVTLPAFTGGDGDLTYTLAASEAEDTPLTELIGGIRFDPDTRQFSGTVTAPDTLPPWRDTYTYAATDSGSMIDGITGGDKVSTVVTINIVSRVTQSVLIGTIEVIVGKAYSTDDDEEEAIILPKFTGGIDTLTYSLVAADGTETVSNSMGDATLTNLGFPGLIFNTRTRRITGTITDTATDQSVFETLKYCAGDSVGNRGFALFTLKVEDARPEFTVVTVRPQFAFLNMEFTDTLPLASDSSADAVTYTISPALPDGLNYNMITGDISGTPTELQEEPVMYTYTATNTVGESASIEFILSVTPPRNMQTSVVNSEIVYVGENFNKILPEFMGGSGEYTYSLVDENGNEVREFSAINVGLTGLSYDPNTRIISGTITDSDADDDIGIPNPVILKHCARDSVGNTGSALFTLTVVDVMPSFGGQTIAPIVAIRDEYLEQTLPAVEDLRPWPGTVTYRVSPNLPAGLTFDAGTRVISGTPAEIHNARNTIFNYTATAGSSVDEVNTNFTIAVTSSPFLAHRITPINFVVRGGPVERVLPRSYGGSGNLNYSLTDENREIEVKSSEGVEEELSLAPFGLDGVTYNPATRTISGIILGTSQDDNKTVNLFHKVEDEEGAVDEMPFKVVVQDTLVSFGDAPTNFNLQAQIGVPFSRKLPTILIASTGYTSTLNITPRLPVGLRYSTGSSSSRPGFRWISISGTPTTIQDAEIYTYRARDTDGDTASIQFSLSVTESSLRPPDYSYRYNDRRTYIPLTIGQDLTGGKAITLPEFIGSTETTSYSIAEYHSGADYISWISHDSGDKTFDLDATLPGLTYNSSTRTISGTYRGSPENDNRIVILLHRAKNDNGIDAVQLVWFTVSGDVAPVFDPTFINNGTIVSIDGELVRLPAYSIAVADGVVPQMPRVRGGNGSPTYTITSSYTGKILKLPGLEHDMRTNQLSGNFTGWRRVGVMTARDVDGDIARIALVIVPQSINLGDFVVGDYGVLTLTQGIAMRPINFPLATAGAYYHPLAHSLTDNDDSTALNLPPGLHYDPMNRMLYGTPTTTQNAASYSYTVKSNACCVGVRTRKLTFTIVVVPELNAASTSVSDAVNTLTPPTVEEVIVMSGREIAPVVLPAFVYDGPHELVYSVTGLPQGIEFTPATRMLSGTPAVVGESAVSYIAEDNVRNAAATTFTLTVIDSTLTDATRSAIPAVSTSVAMAATASAASRIERALRGATQGLDISTAAGQSFQFDPTASSGSSGLRRNPLRFGFWYNTATDELSDTRYEIATNSTTESSNFGFDVSLDFNPDTTLVLGVMQNNSATETEFSRVGGLGDEGALNLDLNSTALYAALGWRGLNVWAISGENDTQIADKTSGVGLPVSFSYQTLGFSADLEVWEDLRIGARIETLQSDLNLPGVGRQLLGDLASAATHTKATLTVNYEFELGKDSNGLLVPRFEFGTRNLSTSEQFQSTSTNARDTASELGFGLDYKQLDWGLTLGLDLRSMAVQNYSSKSMQWSVRWESGHYGKGLSLSLTPTTVAQTLGVDNIYNGDYGAFKSLANRQFGDDSAVSGEGVNVEMGVGLLSGTGTFTPFVRATNLYGSGASTQEFGLRYKTESAISYELKFTQQSRVSSSTNSLTSGISAASSARSDVEQALEFSTRYSF